MVVFGQKFVFLFKVVFSGKVDFIRKKWLLYSGKNGCIRAEVVVFGLSCCVWPKVVVFGQNGCIWAKVFVVEQSGCIRSKVVVFRQKWL